MKNSIFYFKTAIFISTYIFNFKIEIEFLISKIEFFFFFHYSAYLLWSIIADLRACPARNAPLKSIYTFKTVKS